MTTSFWSLIFCGFILCLVRGDDLDDYDQFAESMNMFNSDDLQVDSRSHFDEFGNHNTEYDHAVVTRSYEHFFKQLAPEEAQKRLAVLFDRMDVDNDGELNKTEVTQWIINSFVQLDLEDVGPKFKEKDVNNDGFISWTEYSKLVFGYSEEELENLKDDKSNYSIDFLRSVDEEKVKFDSADLDKNGLLNETEFAAFEHPQNYRHMAPYEIIHTLRSFDKNNDGVISEKEYLEDEMMHKDALVIERANFKRYDQDGNGSLDAEEMKQWVTPGFERMAQDEMEHLFAETDENNDAKLNKAEVLSKHELWVGSYATDYGRHLHSMIKDEL